MSFPWPSFVIVVLVALVVYAGTRVRRARAEHRARSEERAAELLRAMHQVRAQTAAGVSADALVPATRRPSAPAAATPPRAQPMLAGTVPADRPQPAPAAAAPARLARKPRLLSEAQRLLYLSVRAALPDHVVMASIRLADLAERPTAAPRELDARLHTLLLERVDCVVCDAELAPLAALVIYEHGIERVPDERLKIDALRELGIKFLRFRADSLPRPAEMRTLILG